MNLGKIILNKRRELGMTQKELAKGICAQALISKVEQGEHIPKQSILFQLETRLKLEKGELNRLLINSDNSKELKQLIKHIRSCLAKRDYTTINFLIDANKKLIESVEELDNKVFFWWMNTAINFQLYNQKDQALEEFNKMPLEKISDELAIEVTNAKGTIFYEQGKFNQALDIYENILDRINDTIDYRVRAKLFLNYALTLEELDKNKEALYYITLGMEILSDNDSLFLLGDYHHNKGQLFYKMGDYLEAKNNFEFAFHVFSFQKNIKLQALSRFALNDVNNQLNKERESNLKNEL